MLVPSYPPSSMHRVCLIPSLFVCVSLVGVVYLCVSMLEIRERVPMCLDWRTYTISVVTI